MSAKKKKSRKTVNLALQGGGSHGAFTWGVLDALLEDDRLDFDGISATSAGAMNAAALACGYSKGGPEAAREMLERFWREISRAGAFFRPFNSSAFTRFWNLENTPAYAMIEGVMNSISPYQFNPLNMNPLRDVLEKIIDFEEVHACECVNLFITATNVRTGNPRVFENREVTIEALLASACLPLLFQAVEIGGEAYWDGGYMGNPSLWPLFYRTQSRDILLVHVNPIIRTDIPRDAAAIEDRLNEITFNSSLLKELRAVDFVKRLIEEDMLKDEYKDRYKDMLLHAIRADDVLCDLSVSSKYDTDWSFLMSLRDLGRVEGKRWLETSFSNVGRRASIDIHEDYLRTS